MSTWGRITKETLTAIANAIRAKTGKSALIEPVDMPAEIAAIKVGGDLDGVLDGTATTVTSGAGHLRQYALRQHKGIQTLSIPDALNIHQYACEQCTALKSVYAPMALNAMDYAFSGCTSLQTVDVSAMTAIGTRAFSGCTALQEISLPAVKGISSYSFDGCKALKTVDLGSPKFGTIDTAALRSCSALTALVIRATNATWSIQSTTLTGTAIESGTGYIYVPAALLNSYKGGTNWSRYSAQFRTLEDYTDDGTTTGTFIPPAA